MGKFFGSIRRESDHVFQETAYAKGYGPWRPAFDVYELPEKVIILVDLPGVDAKGIEVTLSRGILTVCGIRIDPAPEGLVRIHHMEIDRGRFECRILINMPVDVSRVTAVQRVGYLTIELPKGGPDAR